MVYAACLDEIGGHRLISDETVATVTREQVNGPDAVIPVTMRFGLGFMLGGDQEGRPPAARMAGPSSFGHDGLGGHLAFADPERRIAFGFVTDQPRQPPGADFCTRSLVDALLACLDEESRPSA
jgi:CubicO group peptidase (beta-lactamase class C family)